MFLYVKNKFNLLKDFFKYDKIFIINNKNKKLSLIIKDDKIYTVKDYYSLGIRIFSKTYDADIKIIIRILNFELSFILKDFSEGSILKRENNFEQNCRCSELSIDKNKFIFKVLHTNTAPSPSIKSQIRELPWNSNGWNFSFYYDSIMNSILGPKVFKYNRIDLEHAELYLPEGMYLIKVERGIETVYRNNCISKYILKKKKYLSKIITDNDINIDRSFTYSCSSTFYEDGVAYHFPDRCGYCMEEKKLYPTDKIINEFKDYIMNYRKLSGDLDWIPDEGWPLHCIVI